MRLEEARTIADEVRSLLARGCEEIVIAGSIRRGKAEPKDIELVALARRDTNLLGDFDSAIAALDIAIASAIKEGLLSWDSLLKRNGARYKRLKHTPTGMAIDLFIADQDNFGNTLVIRTGSAEFTKWLLTNRARGGAMPRRLCHAGGYLWQLPTEAMPDDVLLAEEEWCRRVMAAAPQKLSCRTEQDFFHRLGLPFIEPIERNAGAIVALKAHVRGFGKLAYGQVGGIEGR